MSLTGYYRFHAKIYDATRWSFLFGRRELIEDIRAMTTLRRVLEVGCGTGSNLLRLGALFPDAELHGCDLSTDMLAKARRKLAGFAARTRLVQGSYPSEATLASPETGYDLIVFSYCLSMFDRGGEDALEAARASLSSSGRVAVVDFHGFSFPGFEPWMRLNHVRLDRNLLPALEARFTTESRRIRRVLLGAWSYFAFVGRLRD